jgi:hypothetical protein
MTFAQACAVPETLTPNDNAFLYDNLGNKVFCFWHHFKKEIDKIHLISNQAFEFNSFKIEIHLKKIHFKLKSIFRKSIANRK